MEKTIVTGNVILARNSLESAMAMANALQGTRIHISEVRNVRGALDIAELPCSFIVWPEDQTCPCCDRP